MTDSSISSINNLIGTFATVNLGTTEILSTNNLICIDTSNNRLGINTLDPLFEIDVSNNGTINTANLIIYNTLILNNLPSYNINLLQNQIYMDTSGYLKIKK